MRAKIVDSKVTAAVIKYSDHSVTDCKRLTLSLGNLTHPRDGHKLTERIARQENAPDGDFGYRSHGVDYARKMRFDEGISQSVAVLGHERLTQPLQVNTLNNLGCDES
jgi:hypothetical protein